MKLKRLTQEELDDIVYHSEAACLEYLASYLEAAYKRIDELEDSVGGISEALSAYEEYIEGHD